MPYGKHRIPGTETKRISNKHATRYRFNRGTVIHKGKQMRQRFGFRGNKVVEVSFIPVKRRF